MTMVKLTMSDFGGLAPRDQARLLTSFVFQLTVSTRDIFHTNKPNMLDQLRAVNEISHMILSFIDAVTFGDGRSYPPNVLMEILRDNAKNYDIEDAVAFAWDRAGNSFLHL